MASGHPNSCAHATIGSVCHCECSGVRHSVAINGGIPAPAPGGIGKGGKAPKVGKAAPAETPSVPNSPAPDKAPAAADAEASPKAAPVTPAAAFDARMKTAAEGDAALKAAPLSLDDPFGRDGTTPLTDGEQEGLTAYRSEDYRGINHVLRGGTADGSHAAQYVTPGTDRHIAGVDAAMERSKLATDTFTWRGLNNSSVIFGDRLGGNLTGMTWREDAYVSTSADRGNAEYFVGQSSQAERMMMRILTPAGTGAVQLSDEQYEYELLLDRGLSLRIVRDGGIVNGVRMVDVEVLPKE